MASVSLAGYIYQATRDMKKDESLAKIQCKHMEFVDDQLIFLFEDTNAEASLRAHHLLRNAKPRKFHVEDKGTMVKIFDTNLRNDSLKDCLNKFEVHGEIKMIARNGQWIIVDFTDRKVADHVMHLKIDDDFIITKHWSYDYPCCGSDNLMVIDMDQQLSEEELVLCMEDEFEGLYITFIVMMRPQQAYVILEDGIHAQQLVTSKINNPCDIDYKDNNIRLKFSKLGQGRINKTPPKQLSYLEMKAKVTQTDKYTFFWLDDSCFSQWYRAPFTHDGKTFRTAEQFMMYQKAALFDDDYNARAILATDDPELQKKYGRAVKGFNVREWTQYCDKVVRQGNVLKFSQNSDIKDLLYRTKGTKLVEASPYDKIWGIGLKVEDPRAHDESKWQGENKLGKILGSVRDELMRKDGLM